MPHLMIVLIPYINLLNLSWIIKCLFLRNMKPLVVGQFCRVTIYSYTYLVLIFFKGSNCFVYIIIDIWSAEVTWVEVVKI